MLSWEDKEFVRMYVEYKPEIEGSHLRAVKAAIVLRKLLNSAKEYGRMEISNESVRQITLGLHETGKEYAPNEVRQFMELYNFAVEVENQ